MVRRSPRNHLRLKMSLKYSFCYFMSAIDKCSTMSISQSHFKKRKKKQSYIHNNIRASNFNTTIDFNRDPKDGTL